MQDVYWLDPQSDNLLQEITVTQVSHSDEYRIEAEKIYGPNALPATFFDPPERPSWWDKLSGWVGDHIGAHFS